MKYAEIDGDILHKGALVQCDSVFFFSKATPSVRNELNNVPSSFI